VDRLTRKELKQDKFALEVGQTVEYVSTHRQQLIRYGTIALVAVVAAMAIWTWRTHQASARRQALAEAIEIQQAQLGQPVGVNGKTFATEQDKTKAEIDGFTRVAASYPGSEEAALSEYYLGTIAAQQGNHKQAEQWLKGVADSKYADFGSLAKLALAEVYRTQGKLDDAEKVVRSVVANPTVFVSKEEATLALARLVAARNPAEARKLLEPLRTARAAISRAAIAELGNLPQTQ
jgi:predicted negative regulator of RcsB-dependent stress response